MKSILKNIAKTPLAALALSLALAGLAQAGTFDEVKSLWDPRGISGTETASPQSDTPQVESGASQPRWLRLSNGKQVDLRDWKVVLFMQGHCPYCHKFDPVLKQLAGQYGFSVFSYTIDGQGDDAFPEALPAPPDVMQTFFPNIPVATPTISPTACLPWLGRPGARHTTALMAANTGCSCPRKCTARIHASAAAMAEASASRQPEAQRVLIFSTSESIERVRKLGRAIIQAPEVEQWW